MAGMMHAGKRSSVIPRLDFIGRSPAGLYVCRGLMRRLVMSTWMDDVGWGSFQCEGMISREEQTRVERVPVTYVTPLENWGRLCD